MRLVATLSTSLMVMCPVVSPLHAHGQPPPGEAGKPRQGGFAAVEVVGDRERLAGAAVVSPGGPAGDREWEAAPEDDLTAAASGMWLVSNVPSSEREALIALYDATDGAHWVNRTGWLGAVGTECSWWGVRCDAGGTTVVGVSLTNNNLTGAVTDAITALANLEQLWLGFNNLSGSIPTVLGELTSLQSLLLDHNDLTGPVPDTLAQLSQLRTLWLDSNALDGTIPSALGDLTNLEQLTLDHNHLTGSIPTSLGNLAALTYLHLASNQLSGGIPAELGGLANLGVLALSGNPLGGEIPASLGDLESLTDLALKAVQVTGSIPSSLGQLSSLVSLDLSENQLTGPIPASLGDLDVLRTLDLWGNNLEGTIPAELGDLHELWYLHLEGNELTGSIPAELGSMAGLREMWLGFNHLEGPIPPELGQLSALGRLNLRSNQLSGPIPASFGNLSDLESMVLNDNLLTGGLPAELGRLSLLTTLSCSFNLLNEPLPPELGSLRRLQSLSLMGNEIPGPIPPSLGNLGSLRDLDLVGNRLTGPIPATLGGLSNLERIRLVSNMLSGPVPPELANLTTLRAEQSDLRWNAIYTEDAALAAFLDTKQVGSASWQATQTIAPAGLAATSPTDHSVTLTWTPILYTGDGGGYEVYVSRNPGGPFTLAGATPGKLSTAFTVTDLWSGTPYHFRIQAWTDPHAGNLNTVHSDPSGELAAATSGAPAVIRTLTVSTGGTGAGTVWSDPDGIQCGAACTMEVLDGSLVTLSAVADPGMVHVERTGACEGLTGECTVSMTQDHGVSARFEPAGIFSDGFESGTPSAWSASVGYVTR